MITVTELIEKLKQYPQDAQIGTYEIDYFETDEMDTNEESYVWTEGHFCIVDPKEDKVLKVFWGDGTENPAYTECRAETTVKVGNREFKTNQE